MVLQRSESFKRCAAVGASFRGITITATGTRRRRRRFVPVAIRAHGRRLFKSRKMIVHVHLNFDVRHQRLSAYDTGSRERHLVTVHVDRIAVLLEMLIELIFVIDDHFTVTAYSTRRDLQK